MLRRTVHLIAYWMVFSLTSPSFAYEVLHKSSSDTFISLPLTRQSTDYTCGAAAALSILGFYGDQMLEMDLANRLKTNADFGTERERLVEFFESNDYRVAAKEGMTVDELKGLLFEGKPVLCLIQAWEDDIKDYSNYWGIGHYVVAIGYDPEHIYFMDPWILGNYGYIPTKVFESRWHQFTSDKKRLMHWGMAVSKPQSGYHPEAILYIP